MTSQDIEDWSRPVSWFHFNSKQNKIFQKSTVTKYHCHWASLRPTTFSQAALHVRGMNTKVEQVDAILGDSQSGGKKKYDESFQAWVKEPQPKLQKFRRASSPHPTDCPGVSGRLAECQTLENRDSKKSFHKMSQGKTNNTLGNWFTNLNDKRGWMGLVLNNPTNSSATDVLTRDIVKVGLWVKAKYIGFLITDPTFTFSTLDPEIVRKFCVCSCWNFSTPY